MNSKKPIAPLCEVDFVFVHKDLCLLDAFVWLAKDRTKKVNVYADQQRFLAHVRHYPKDTKIVLGRTFHHGEQTGIQIAYYLHELGFKRLYLITFSETLKHQIPNYLTNIPSEDGEGLERIFLEE